MQTNGPKFYFVCTGLGVVQRGFESYMLSLSEKLSKTEISFLLLTGGDLGMIGLPWKRLISVNRKNKISNYFFGTRVSSEIEQFTFFISMCFQIFKGSPSVIYLGEYKLYCYLFKLRKYFLLKYSLVLYTGGQVMPGLFDVKRDYVHHVTDVYINELTKIGYPASRQFLIPHFTADLELENLDTIELIHKKAGLKKIILSVGLIDKKIKRMDLLLQSLSTMKNKYFPVILGETSIQTKEINDQALILFGENQYYISTVKKNELINFYKAADAFVLLSKKESFGLAYLEALQAGKPVVAMDFHESRFVLRDKAYFVNEDQIKNLSVILDEIIMANDEYKSKSRINFVNLNYSWNSLQFAYIDMFNKISING